MLLNISDYKTVIFDFDGVIADSNEIKKTAISCAAAQVFDEDKLKEFVNYFTRYNGAPREEKIARFAKNKIESGVILERYNKLLSEREDSVKLTCGCADLIAKLHNLKKRIIIVSGGDKSEIRRILNKNKILRYFDEVHTAPKSKIENIKNVNFELPVVFIGDSEVDYEAAFSLNIDFIFMSAHSQMEGWELFFKEKSNVRCINDLRQLIP